jgi:Tol biopolymer transport system component
MRIDRPIFLRYAAVFWFSIVLLLSPGRVIESKQPDHEISQIMMDKELICNGDFNLGKTGWRLTGKGSGIGKKNVASGDACLSMAANRENRAVLIQTLYPLSQITTAAVSFEYRLLPGRGGSAQLYAGIASDTATLFNILVTRSVSKDTGWEKVDVTLNAAVLAKIQAAHNAGQILYLTFTMVQNRPDAFKALLDNVSLQVSGLLHTPHLGGKIAYIATDYNGYSRSIKSISIGPKIRYPKTLWTFPGTGSGIPKIFDLDFSPDSQKLAFCSNHESAYSALYSAVYTIDTDGSSPGRLTRPPTTAKDERCLITDICWNRQGSEICFCRNGTPLKIPATSKNGEPAVGSLFEGTSRAFDLAYSPLKDRLLYRNDDYGRGGIYIITPGDSTGSPLIPDGDGAAEEPAWLPDGTGFVFIHGSDLYQYDFAGRTVSRLTYFFHKAAAHPCLSPDGRYIVFERRTLETEPVQRDLWILNRQRPTEMWQLTENGRSSHPVWGKD